MFVGKMVRAKDFDEIQLGIPANTLLRSSKGFLVQMTETKTWFFCRRLRYLGKGVLKIDGDRKKVKIEEWE